jgi:hypothetical protein
MNERLTCAKDSLKTCELQSEAEREWRSQHTYVFNQKAKLQGVDYKDGTRPVGQSLQERMVHLT